MAEMNPMNPQRHAGKASSLPGGAPVSVPETSRRRAGRRGAGRDGLTTRRRTGSARPMILDAVLILVLAAVITGAVFGYRALRSYFSPAWQTKDVYFVVCIQNVDPDMLTYADNAADREGDALTLIGKSIWSSDRTDADRLGTVVSADIRSQTGDSPLVTLYLTVFARASYRPGEGYRMGDTRLLAGDSGLFRLEGLVSLGEILTLDESGSYVPFFSETEAASDEGTTADGSLADAETDGAAPAAQNENAPVPGDAEREGGA